MKRVKIGLAGLYFPNFEAEEYEVYKRSITAMITLANKMEIELVAKQEMISTRKQARSAAEFFRNEKIDFLLLQASSLILGDIILPFAEASERIGFWVVPEPSLNGELSLNSLTGFNLGVSILRKNYPYRLVKWFYGSPDCDSPDFQDRLQITARALRCLKNLQGSRIGLINDVVPTFINLTFNSESLKKNLGVEVVKLPLNEVFQRTSSQETIQDSLSIEEEMVQAAAEIKVPRIEISNSSRLTRSLIDTAREFCLNAVALRCWPEFQDILQIAPCASISYLNDHGLITSCEGDLPGALSMLAAWYISGEAPTMNDPVALDIEKELFQMWHCGPGPVSWADENGQTLDWHHTLNRRVPEGKKRTGLSSDISFREGPVTLLRISGDGNSIFVMEADIVTGPLKPYPGSGGWAGNLTSNGRSVTTADFLQSITEFGLEHHYPVMRGHHEAAVREMASWAGIQVIDIPKAEKYVK